MNEDSWSLLIPRNMKAQASVHHCWVQINDNRNGLYRFVCLNCKSRVTHNTTPLHGDHILSRFKIEVNCRDQIIASVMNS